MAIVIEVPTVDSISTYAELQAFVTAHLELDQETQDNLPNLIRMGEARMARLLTHPERETTTTFSTSSQTYALPDDFVQMRNLRITGDQGYTLEQVTAEVLFAYSPSGKPKAYSMIGGNLVFGPEPDGSYDYSMVYLAKLVALTDTNETNWLLTDHPDAYVYATLMQAELFLGNDERAIAFKAGLDEVLAEINAAARRMRMSVPMRLRSPAGFVV